MKCAIQNPRNLSKLHCLKKLYVNVLQLCVQTFLESLYFRHLRLRELSKVGMREKILNEISTFDICNTQHQAPAILTKVFAI